MQTRIGRLISGEARQKKREIEMISIEGWAEIEALLAKPIHNDYELDEIAGIARDLLAELRTLRSVEPAPVIARDATTALSEPPREMGDVETGLRICLEHLRHRRMAELHTALGDTLNLALRTSRSPDGADIAKFCHKLSGTCVMVPEEGRATCTPESCATMDFVTAIRAEAIEECAKAAERCEVTLNGDDPFGNAQIATALRALSTKGAGK